MAAKSSWGRLWREEGGWRMRLVMGALTALGGVGLGVPIWVLSGAHGGRSLGGEGSAFAGLAFLAGCLISGGFGREGLKGWLRAILSSALAFLCAACMAGALFLTYGFLYFPSEDASVPEFVVSLLYFLTLAPLVVLRLLLMSGFAGILIWLALLAILQPLAIWARRRLGPPAAPETGINAGNGASR